tara:strand:- start:2096 stop:4387 length:2292 start_codon:yes stop_codon:yes gene_type:complete
MTELQVNVPDVNADQFLEAIFGHVKGEAYILLACQNGQGRGFRHAPYGSKAAEQWIRAMPSDAIYFNVSVVCEPQPGENEPQHWRRRKKDCLLAYVLVLDDVGTKGKTPPVEPSYKLESSSGNFQWGYIIKPYGNLDKYAAVVDAVSALGFADEGAGGYNRLMRVPGSVDTKPDRKNFVSKITEWHPERRFELEDLAKRFGIETSTLNLSRATPSPIAIRNPVDVQHDIDLVLVWLQENGFVLQDDGAEWVVVRCPWHDEHTTGSDTAGYSPLGRGDAGWRETRGFKCMHAHCAERRYKNYSSWIVENGGPSAPGIDPLPLIQRQWIIVNRGTQFADMFQRPNGGEWIYSEKEWSNMHYRHIKLEQHEKPILLKSAFMEHPATRRATAFKYRPGGGETIEHHKQTYVNSWTEPLHEETDELPEIFLKHMDYILPIASERECFLNWLAYKIQHPASRSYAVVMVADNVFGTGRSWIAKMLERVTQGQSGKATLKQLIGKGTSAEQNYNDWSAGRQFLFVNEAKDVSKDDFYRGYETFKDLVDTSTYSIRINPKFGHIREEEIYWNALIFTNHVDAISLPANDRRIAVFSNANETKSTDYYAQLFNALDGDEPARVYQWLKRRDVTGFNHTTPPKSTAKLKMIEMTRDAVDELMDCIREISASDIITHELCIQLTETAARNLAYDGIEHSPGATARRIWKRLDSLRPGEPNGFRIKVNNKRLECRAINFHTYWQKAAERKDSDLFKKELEKHTKDFAVGLSSFPR